MNLAALAVLTYALAQASEAPPSSEEPIMRRRQSPPAQMDDETLDRGPRGRQAPADDEEDGPTQDDYRARNRELPEEPQAERLAPLDAPARQKLRPPEIVAEALEAPRQGALVGTPMTLREALAGATDRQKQLSIAHAYWKLCAMQAEYHWARNERDLLGQYTESHTTLPSTLSARASARAHVRDAQLAVTQAQQDLADQIGMRGDASPPLASDRPHVGDYNTHFETLFAGRVPPARLRLIHRTMPVRRRAIDAHGEAIVAALDALEITGEEFRQQGEGMATVMNALEQLRAQRRAFIEDVQHYNQEIAEYAFNVAPATANGDTLVSMLIKTAPRAAQPATRNGRANDPRRATRATFESEAAPTPARRAPAAARESEAPRFVPPSAGRGSEAPRFVPAPHEAPAEEPALHEPEMQEPAAEEPSEAEPAAEDSNEPAPADEPAPELEPRSRYDRGANYRAAELGEGELADPVERTVRYRDSPEEESEEGGIYQGLLSVEGPTRVQKLSNLLHWDRNLPRDAGQPISLTACLKGLSPADRLATIDAFWRVREQAARYQVLAEQLDQLSALPAIAINMRDQSGIAEATVRLQAARKAARAELLDAHRDLLAAEFELTQAARRPLNAEWLLASTAPQGGRYIVSAGRPRRVDPRAVHWGEMVRVNHEKLAERADAVVQADVNRSLLTSEARDHARGDAGSADEPMRLDTVLRAVARQNQETLDFLHDLTEYNKAIARFALVTWPAGTPEEQLVRKLVVARSTRRDS